MSFVLICPYGQRRTDADVSTITGHPRLYMGSNPAQSNPCKSVRTVEYLKRTFHGRNRAFKAGAGPKKCSWHCSCDPHGHLAGRNDFTMRLTCVKIGDHSA